MGACGRQGDADAVNDILDFRSVFAMKKESFSLNTEQLIRSLVADLATPSGSVGKVIAICLSTSLLISFLSMWLVLGFRADIHIAMGSMSFWLKAIYTFIIGSVGLFAVERFGRPGLRSSKYFLFVGFLIASFALAAALEIMQLPEADRTKAWLGDTWAICPWLIVAESIPILIAAFVILRRMAPTQRSDAAAAAGLMAGGYGACIYSLHCGEQTLPFLACWYTFGVATVVAISFLGRSYLRW